MIRRMRTLRRPFMMLSVLSTLVLVAAGVSVTEKPARVPWTTSRLTGSPDPPLPYRLERAFPKIGFTNLVDMQPMPGTSRLAAVEQSGKIFTFVEDAASEK